MEIGLGPPLLTPLKLPQIIALGCISFLLHDLGWGMTGWFHRRLQEVLTSISQGAPKIANKPPKARPGASSLLQTSAGISPADTLTLDFQPPELRWYISIVCGTLLKQP